MFSLHLWRYGPFVRFFCGASLSVVGDWFNTVAIAVLVYRLTGRVSSVALAILLSVLPRVILAPIGGALADRFERRRVLIALDGARAAVALLPLLVHDAGSIWLVYATLLLLQVGACIYNPTQGAYLSHLVPDDRLESANAAYAAMRDVGIFAGPALAAAVLGLWGPAAGFCGNALSFAVSAGVLLSLPRAGRSAVRAPGLRSLLVDYARIVSRYPRVTALYLCFLAGAVPIFFFQAIMVVYARDLGQPVTFIGVLYAAAGLGGALGGCAMGHYLRRLPYGAAVAIFGLKVPLLGALALVLHTGPALVLLACSTAAGTAGDLIFTVGVQRHVAPGERGRAFGLWYWCMSIGQLIGAGLGTVATERTAVPMLLWVCMGVLPLILVGAFLSVRASQPAGRVPSGAVAQPAR